MVKEDKAKKLGFNSVEEMKLYCDVCGTDNPYEPESLEKLLESLNNDYVSNKNDFIKYINNNNLIELFDKVKNMTLLNRFVEIYSYYSNCILVCRELKKTLGYKLQEAKSLYDGEKEIEFEEKLSRIFRMEDEYCEKIQYIVNQTHLRLSPTEKSSFYITIKKMKDVLLFDNDEKNRSI